MHKLLIAFLVIAIYPDYGFSQTGIQGKWESQAPERTGTSFYSIRQFDFAKESWEVQYTLYLDSALKLPVFTFRADGNYSINKESSTVKGAREALFRFENKYLTLKTKDTSVIRKFGMDKCELVFFKEKNITEAGCANLVSRTVCGQEFDLVKISGNKLYLGARPQSGGMCEELKRPKSLGLPLVRTVTNDQSGINGIPALSKMNIVDLTHTLNERFPYIPTPVTYAFQMKPIATIDNFGVAANEWKIHEHIGTQFDAPNHFIKGGMSAEQIKVSNLFVPAVVLDISEKAGKDRDAVLTAEDILTWEKKFGRIPQNAAVLLYSGWEKKIYSPDFIGMDSSHKKHFPGISKEAAELLVNQRSISGVGVDVISIDPGIDDTYQAHRVILEKGKWALECLANLDKIPKTGAYIFVGAPKVEGATGGISRVIAIW